MKYEISAFNEHHPSRWSDDSNSSQAICKISDFGTSREVDMKSTFDQSQSMTMTSNIGTPLYMAPEILSGVGHYSMKADVYSYGILMASLWNQEKPFFDVSMTSASELISHIVDEQLRPSVKSDCPQSYLNLLSACWTEDPHKRPSFDEMCEFVFGSS